MIECKYLDNIQHGDRGPRHRGGGQGALRNGGGSRPRPVTKVSVAINSYYSACNKIRAESLHKIETIEIIKF